MTTKIETMWKDLLREARGKPIEGEGYRLLRMAEEVHFDIYAGIDASDFRLLAVGVHMRPPNITINSSSLDFFRQQRHDATWLMVLRLRELEVEAVFGRLCQDLVDAAEGVPDEKALVNLVKERLNLWIKLFQQGRGGLLQPHEIKGLVAELIVLEWLIQSKSRDLCETVTGWKGPLGADQDFLYSDTAIEVKAIGPGAEVVSISSLNQLESRVPVHLIVVRLRQAASGEKGAIGLNTLSARIEGLIAECPEALNTFKAVMLEARYVEHEFYNTVLFEPVSHDSFLVSNGFPRLVSSMVAAGIVSATYEIGISDIAEFREDFLP